MRGTILSELQKFWKERKHLVEAMVNGETVQYLPCRSPNLPVNWVDMTSPQSLMGAIHRYRIKPEPEYRAFRDGIEAMSSIGLHVRHHEYPCSLKIVAVTMTGVYLFKPDTFRFVCFEDLVEKYEFREVDEYGVCYDVHPVGVEIDEH